VAVALLLVVVPLAVVVSEEVPNDRPAFCLLLNGVSWLPVDSLPEALRQHVTDETATQVMNGITLVPIKRFVEAQGGSVGWDSVAEAVTVEFDDQTIPFKALHSDSFWASPSVRTLRTTLLSISTDSNSEPSTELGTNSSEQWEPPRLVDGVWVTSGVSDEQAKQYAAQHNADKTEAEIRDQEWDVHWQWHWDEADAPQWASQRGQGVEAAQIARQKAEDERGWRRWYANQPRLSEWDRVQYELDMKFPAQGDWWRRFGQITDMNLPPAWENPLLDLNESIFELDMLNKKLEDGWRW